MKAARVHPVFGTVRQVSCDNRCSICSVDAGEVPLMFFAQTGDDACVYCDDCAEFVAAIALKQAEPRA